MHLLPILYRTNLLPQVPKDNLNVHEHLSRNTDALLCHSFYGLIAQALMWSHPQLRILQGYGEMRSELSANLRLLLQVIQGLVLQGQQRKASLASRSSLNSSSDCLVHDAVPVH